VIQAQETKREKERIKHGFKILIINNEHGTKKNIEVDDILKLIQR